MQIVEATQEVINEINKSLIKSGANTADLRIVRRLELFEDNISDAFSMYQSEITLNDQVQELDGINFIVANILVDLFGGFSLSCKDNQGRTEIQITPYKIPSRLKGAASNKGIE